MFRSDRSVNLIELKVTTGRRKYESDASTGIRGVENEAFNEFQVSFVKDDLNYI